MLTQKTISKAEAQKRTEAHKRDFSVLRKGWVHLGQEVAQSVDLGVPSALGMGMRDWLDTTFEESASHIFRQLQNVRALKGVSQAQLERMPEGNAHQLATRLPEKERKNPAVIKKAMEQAPAEFRATVKEIREKKYGIKPEPFKTFAVAVPMGVYDQLIAAQDKMAAILGLDLADEKKHAYALITIWEAVAVLINQTDESKLKAEVEGDEAAHA